MARLDYDELLHTYRGVLVVGRKNTDELFDWLRGMVTVEPIAPHEIGRAGLSCAVENAVRSPEGERLKLAAQNARFAAVRVVRDACSRAYYDVFDRTNTRAYPDIYVLIERATGHIDCNSNELFMELELARGVAQRDLDERTQALRSYLVLLAHRDHPEWDA